MVSAVFQQAVKEATGTAWEEWIEKLERTLDLMWSHEQMKNHICGTFYLSDEWGEWLAVMYGQRLGRKPVGVTKDAGVQIGVRKTLAATKETLDREHGRFPAGKRIRLFFCGRRDRPTYGRSAVRMAAHDMETSGMGQAVPAANPSAARVIGQNDGRDPSGNAGDVYIRELMRRHWEEALHRMRIETEAASQPPGRCNCKTTLRPRSSMKTVCLFAGSGRGRRGGRRRDVYRCQKKDRARKFRPVLVV